LWKGQGIALLCAAAGLGIRLSLNPYLGDTLPVALFYPFVLIAAVWGGTCSGLTVLVICRAAADLLWLQPGYHLVTLIAFAVACFSIIAMAGLFRAVVEIHVQDEERAILLAHEMTHRVGNLFGVVQAISAQSARHAATVADYQTQFTGRLMALARTQRLIAHSTTAATDLKSFIGEIIEPFGPPRFAVDGPHVVVPRYMGTSCALLLHELCTNALKYGSLSVPEGVVDLSWRVQDHRVYLHWRERHGPHVAAPQRTGFGSRLLKTAFPAEHGSADLRFEPDGVQCDVEFALL